MSADKDEDDEIYDVYSYIIPDLLKINFGKCVVLVAYFDAFDEIGEGCINWRETCCVTCSAVEAADSDNEIYLQYIAAVRYFVDRRRTSELYGYILKTKNEPNFH